jgi:hypothetical protein
MEDIRYFSLQMCGKYPCMRIVSIVYVVIVLVAVSSCNSRRSGQPKARRAAVDTTKRYSNNDFVIVTPPKWAQENYTFPLEFAKEIPYKGYEDAMFSPFWGDRLSDEFWTYVIIWWLSDSPQFNERIFGQVLQQYYTGLARKSRPGTATPSDSASRAKVEVTKAKTDSSDMATYNASAIIYDGNISMAQLHINLKIHVLSCGKGRATVVIYEISPKDYASSVWQTLDIIKSQFTCSN